MAAEHDDIHDDETADDSHQAETAGGNGQATRTTRAKTAEERLAEAESEREALKAEKDRIAKALKEANRKAEDDRRFRKEYEARQKEKQDAELGDLERANRDLAEAQARLKEIEDDARASKAALIEERNSRVIEKAAADLKPKPFLRPSAAQRLIERSRLKFDEDTGEVDAATVAAELKRLAAEMPELLGATSGNGTPNRDVAPRNTNGSHRGAGQMPSPDQVTQAHLMSVAGGDHM